MSAAGDALGDAIKTAIENAVSTLTDPTNADNSDRTVIARAIGNAIIDNVSYASNIFKNLVIHTNFTNPNYQIDVSWDALVIGAIEESSFSDTIDITLDLDTGSEAGSTLYYIWAMAGEGKATICKFSTSFTNPTLPAGYTEKQLISMVYNDSSNNFEKFFQRARNYSSTKETNGLALFSQNMSGTTYYDIDLTTFSRIPDLEFVSELSCYCQLSHTSISPDFVAIWNKFDASTRVLCASIYDADAVGGLMAQYRHQYVVKDMSFNSAGASNVNFKLFLVGYVLNIRSSDG